MSPAEKASQEKAKRPHKSNGRNRIWNCRLGEMRAKLGLSLRDIKAKTGISDATVHAIEQGCDPQLSNARKLADFFGVTIEEMWPTRFGFELRKGTKS